MTKLKWKVTKTVPTECPDYKPNPYTGEYPTTHCSVYHYKTIIETREQEFKTKEEAIEFAHKAPYSCSEFQLDGKLLEDKRSQQPKLDTITLNGL